MLEHSYTRKRNLIVGSIYGLLSNTALMNVTKRRMSCLAQLSLDRKSLDISSHSFIPVFIIFPRSNEKVSRYGMAPGMKCSLRIPFSSSHVVTALVCSAPAILLAIVARLDVACIAHSKVGANYVARNTIQFSSNLTTMIYLAVRTMISAHTTQQQEHPNSTSQTSST